MDFPNAYHAVRGFGMTSAGAPLTREALNAIQWSHRTGALSPVALVVLNFTVLKRSPV